MRITYSRTYDALAVELAPGPCVESISLGPGITADIDREGRLICIEVLNASAWYSLPQLETLPSAVELITVREAARDSGFRVSTLRKHILAGRIPGARKDGRDWLLPRHELRSLLQNRPRIGRPPGSGKPPVPPKEDALSWLERVGEVVKKPPNR